MKARSLFALGLLLYFCTVAVNLPLAWLIEWSGVQQNVLTDIQGTVWNGRARVQLPMQENASLNWQVSPSGLFSLSLPVFLTVTGADWFTSANVVADLDQVELLNVDGQAYPSALKRFMARRKVEVGQGVEWNFSRIVVDKQLVIHDARGLVEWPGGPLSYPVGRNREQRDMPPMAVFVSQQGSDTVVQASASNDPEAFWMQTVVDADQIATVEIYQRVLDELGLPGAGTKSPDAVALKISQPIINE